MTEEKLRKANELLGKITETKNAISFLVEDRRAGTIDGKRTIHLQLGSPESHHLFEKFREELIEQLTKKLKELEVKFEKI